ncbi:hypothetical protein OO013_09240 [Mangrovivirga sp. M17]|uniref:LysM domain-containing protein n=1 Tax=Mangrovivirga halotolerans TaxID=2993936 RepID=A0ABT3RR61_9BACT|nr:hypothetical protein [Mangrovivirga halotolerans]MCX2744048.1 hypothetical protein [Mangrovivirga halotolerans]
MSEFARKPKQSKSGTFNHGENEQDDFSYIQEGGEIDVNKNPFEGVHLETDPYKILNLQIEENQTETKDPITKKAEKLIKKYGSDYNRLAVALNIQIPQDYELLRRVFELLAEDRWIKYFEEENINIRALLANEIISQLSIDELLKCEHRTLMLLYNILRETNFSEYKRTKRTPGRETKSTHYFSFQILHEILFFDNVRRSFAESEKVISDDKEAETSEKLSRQRKYLDNIRNSEISSATLGGENGLTEIMSSGNVILPGSESDHLNFALSCGSLLKVEDSFYLLANEGSTLEDVADFFSLDLEWLFDQNKFLIQAVNDPIPDNAVLILGKYQFYEKYPYYLKQGNQYLEVKVDNQILNSPLSVSNKVVLNQLLKTDWTDSGDLENILSFLEKEIKGNPYALIPIKKKYFEEMGVTIEDELYNIDPEYFNLNVSTILKLRKLIVLNVSDQSYEQEIVNQQQKLLQDGENAEVTTINANLWNDLTISELTTRAKEALNAKTVDKRTFFQALFNLNGNADNIKLFLSEYPEIVNDLKRVLLQYNNLHYSDYQNALKYLDFDVYDDELQVKATEIDMLARQDFNEIDYNTIFGEGKLIVRKHKSGDYKDYYYTVPGFSPEQDDNQKLDAVTNFLCIGKDELRRNNYWDAIDSTGMIHIDDNQYSICDFPKVKVPPKSFHGKPHIQISDERVSYVGVTDYSKDYASGKDIELEDPDFKPEILESHLRNLFTLGKVNGLTSTSQTLKIKLKGSLYLIVYLGVSAEEEFKSSMTEGGMISASLDLSLKGNVGVEGVGEISTTFKKESFSTPLYEGVDFFLVNVIHQITNFLLDNGEYIPEFQTYWDKGKNRDLLAAGYYKPESSESASAKAQMSNNDGKQSGTISANASKSNYKHYSGKRVFDDRSDPEMVREVSSDFMEEQGGKNYVVQLSANDMVTIQFLKTGSDKNIDLLGNYINVVFNIKATNFKSLLESMMKTETFTEGDSLIRRLMNYFQGNTAGALVDDLKRSVTEYAESFVSTMRNPDKMTIDNLAGYNVEIKEGIVNKALKKFNKNLRKYETKLPENPKDPKKDLTEQKLQFEGDANVKFDMLYDLSERTFNRTRIFTGAKLKVNYSSQIGTVAASVKLETEVEGSIEGLVYERPGTNTLKYISRQYNRFMNEADVGHEKLLRDSKYSEAQKARLESGDPLKEKEIIEKYWQEYEHRRNSKNDKYYSNDKWEKYKSNYNDEIKELFANFLKPIVETVQKKTKERNSQFIEPMVYWTEINDLMTIDAGEAFIFTGYENAYEFLTKEFVVENKKDILQKDSNTLSKGLSNNNTLQIFEKLILFNLYKNHQKHEWDYYGYKKEN